MEIRNSFSILFTKFSLNYRVLIYMFFAIAIMVGISVSIIIPVFSEIFESPETSLLFKDLRVKLADYFGGEATFKEFTEAATVSYESLMSLISSTKAPVVFWITFIAMCILIRFAAAFSYPVIMDIIHNFMSSNMSYGFMSNMLKNNKLCFKFAGPYTLITSITDVLIVFSVVGLIRVFLPLIGVFAFTVALLAAVIFFAARMALTSVTLPEMLLTGEGNFFKAFKKSWPSLKKNYNKMFGAFCITLFTAYVIIMVTTVLTFGIAFFVLVAMFMTYTQILQLVFYYSSKSMRYYIDNSTIIYTAPIEERLDLQEEMTINEDNK